MKVLGKILVASALGAGAMGLTSTGASAAIVCTGTACWHTTEAYEYPAAAGVIVHPDSWRWAETDHYTWRKHPGRGYWRGEEREDF